MVMKIQETVWGKGDKEEVEETSELVGKIFQWILRCLRQNEML
jgi:hypothetical protein